MHFWTTLLYGPDILKKNINSNDDWITHIPLESAFKDQFLKKLNAIGLGEVFLKYLNIKRIKTSMLYQSEPIEYNEKLFKKYKYERWLNNVYIVESSTNRMNR